MSTAQTVIVVASACTVAAIALGIYFLVVNRVGRPRPVGPDGQTATVPDVNTALAKILHKENHFAYSPVTIHKELQLMGVKFDGDVTALDEYLQHESDMGRVALIRKEEEVGGSRYTGRYYGSADEVAAHTVALIAMEDGPSLEEIAVEIGMSRDALAHIVTQRYGQDNFDSPSSPAKGLETVRPEPLDVADAPVSHRCGRPRVNGEPCRLNRAGGVKPCQVHGTEEDWEAYRLTDHYKTAEAEAERRREEARQTGADWELYAQTEAGKKMIADREAAIEKLKAESGPGEFDWLDGWENVPDDGFDAWRASGGPARERARLAEETDRSATPTTWDMVKRNAPINLDHVDPTA